MSAIVIGLNASGWIAGVVVECVEMGTDLLYRCEVLDHRSSALQDATLHCPWIAWKFISVAAAALFEV